MPTISLLIVLLSLSIQVYAAPSAPRLQLDTDALQVSLQWSGANDADGYILSYAPFPFRGINTIRSVDLGGQTNFSIELWQNAAFYVAVQAYNSDLQKSEYSNIGFIFIQEQSQGYHQFWRAVTKEISQKMFVSDDFLYAQTPDINSCFAGTTSLEAQLRELNTLNEIRKLHRLPALSYDNSANTETQQAALIQKANNFLSHTPPENSLCYSQLGDDGSNSSNLHIGSDGNSDPAGNLIGFIDDASNISSIAGVGHRRALLNPFMQFTSYGQVFGASATKVSAFSTSSSVSTDEIPKFIAFPYLRYPYAFFSDKTLATKTPWNITIIEDKRSFWGNQFNYFTDAKLSIRQKSSGQLMHTEDLHTDTRASGVPNNFSWTVTNWEYDTWYTVVIDNIHYQSGETGNIQYDVFIDYKNIIDITEPLEAGDQQNTRSMQGTLLDQEDSDSYEFELDGQVTFSGNSQFSNMAFYILVYDANKLLVMVSDQPFSLDLPSGHYTLVISNCHLKTCYTQAKNYSVRLN